MGPSLANGAPSYWWSAAADLSQRDSILAPIIAQFPGEALEPHGDVFRTLARAIVGQQISVLAAEHIWRRLLSVVGGVSPDHVAGTSVDRLRGCGLTRRKAGYLISIARMIPTGDTRWRQWLELNDDDLHGHLTGLSGVGPWTSQMVMIFAAGRADVLPTGDVGLRRVAGRYYGRGDQALSIDQLVDVAEGWRPWRSVAVWYLWRSVDPVPVVY